jgi:hypothetical protein
MPVPRLHTGTQLFPLQNAVTPVGELALTRLSQLGTQTVANLLI